jgi:RNA polymerase sigma-70 factor, ECF subfamily
LDGERPQVLAQQVDAHLESCRGCRAWLIGAAVQTRRLASIEPGQGPDLVDKIMATIGEQSTAYPRRMRVLRSHYRRWALIYRWPVSGGDRGRPNQRNRFRHGDGHMHGAMSGEHLMHESTA